MFSGSEGLRCSHGDWNPNPQHLCESHSWPGVSVTPEGGDRQILGISEQPGAETDPNPKIKWSAIEEDTQHPALASALRCAHMYVDKLTHIPKACGYILTYTHTLTLQSLPHSLYPQVTWDHVPTEVLAFQMLGQPGNLQLSPSPCGPGPRLPSAVFPLLCKCHLS